jgi:DMSO/TMAO reductase YedYZ molybdopterin-dependent catalytic subunit
MFKLAFGFTAAILTLAAQETAAIKVTGAVKQALTLTADDLAKMPRTKLKVTLHGTEAVYEGVSLFEILKRAGAPQGEALRGKALAGYMLAKAQDGYQVVFSLGELDPGFINDEILVADTANGKPLAGNDGRFRLIVPKDKPAARSVRMLTKLEIVQLRK